MRGSERALRTAIIAIVALGTTACTQIDNALASVPVFSFLREAPFMDPYEMPRQPAPGSIPFWSPAGRVLPPIEASEAGLNAFAATEYGRNPYATMAGDTAWLGYGRTMYERHCSVCHGPAGAADGPIIAPEKFPPVVPSLLQGAALGRSEGYLYGIIRVGRGLMPAYGARTSDQDRWAIVNYVQQLQRAAGGTPAAPPATTDTTAAQTAAPATTDTSAAQTAAPATTDTPAAPAPTDTAAASPAGEE